MFVYGGKALEQDIHELEVIRILLSLYERHLKILNDYRISEHDLMGGAILVKLRTMITYRLDRFFLPDEDEFDPPAKVSG